MTEHATTETGTNDGYKRQTSEDAASATGGDYLKWQPGEKKDLVILSPHGKQRLIHWNGKQSSDCTGPGCPLCAAGNKTKTRWLVNTSGKDGEKQWEMANSTFGALEDVAEILGFLKGMSITVVRKGSGTDTHYTIVPLDSQVHEQPAATASDDLGKKIKALCAENSTNPAEEARRWLALVDPELRAGNSLLQLEAFYVWLQQQYAPIDMGRDEEPPEEVDLTDMF